MNSVLHLGQRCCSELRRRISAGEIEEAQFGQRVVRDVFTLWRLIFPRLGMFVVQWFAAVCVELFPNLFFRSTLTEETRLKFSIAYFAFRIPIQPLGHDLDSKSGHAETCEV